MNVNSAQTISNYFKVMQQFNESSSTKNESRLISIRNTLMLGKKLSTAEIEYLKQHDPNLHSQVLSIAMERQAYEKALRQSRSKADVNNYNTINLIGITGHLKNGGSEEQLMRANAIQEAHLEFLRSSKYASLKSNSNVPGKLR